MNKDFIIKVNIIVSNGTGMCSITSRETKKVYTVRGPKYSMISDNEMSKLLMKEALNEFYEHEVKVVETARPKQLTID